MNIGLNENYCVPTLFNNHQYKRFDCQKQQPNCSCPNFKGAYCPSINSLSKLNVVSKDKNFAQKLKDVINSGHNFLGEGMSNRAYDLKDIGLPDMVLRIPKSAKMSDLSLKFKFIKDEFFGYNFGQAISCNGAGIMLLKKVNGEPHGVSSNIIMNGNQVNHEIAQAFLTQLKNISSFKDSAYVDLAKQFDIVNKTNRYFVDVNPNNLLIDQSKEKFNLIDLLDKNNVPMYEDFKSDVNTMICILIDGLMHMKTYDKLSPEEQKQYIKYSEIIINKCHKAAKIVGLEKSDVPMEHYFDLLMNYDGFTWNRKHHELWSKRYNRLCETYNCKSKASEITAPYNTAALCKRFDKAGQVPKFYISFLRKMNLLTDEQILEIVEKYPDKIDKFDLDWLIENRVPLTKFDTAKIIENRIACKNATEVNEQSKEYLDTILNTEFEKFARTPNDKKMVIVTGLPASGKSQLIEREFNENYYIADIDIIKTMFPSYEKEGKKLNNLHSISRKILQQEIIPKAIEQGKNIVIPTTGLEEYIVRLATPAKANGYNVEIIHCSTTPAESIKNVIDRFEREERFVDPYFVTLRAPYLKEPFTDLKKTKLIDGITTINNL